MYTYILGLFVLLFIAFFAITKNELVKSIGYSIFFIITLWMNEPCFFSISDINAINGKIYQIPFQLFQNGNVFYIFAAEIISVIMLYKLTMYSKTHTSYTHKEVKKQYDRFVSDAMELYIIGKDLDFLDKKEYKKQIERIIHLKNRSKLLCELTEDEKLLNIYEGVCKYGVGVKFYTESDNITNLKGQIKVDQNGNKKAIFVTRKNNKYKLTHIDNQFLVNSILKEYNKVYNNLSAEQ